ncbi:histone H1-like [Conger conger]|uniref:histone H1-like n=1 Tax=Conger conger TaxID=82655 RepID=UPI002A59DFC6|nr:histone H1-like [Conger conger]
MAESAPAPAPAPVAPAKTTKKKTAIKPKSTGPSLKDLILKEVSASKERSGVSLATLKKGLVAGGYNLDKNNSRVNLAVKAMVASGTLVQTKGKGASGSFKVNKKTVEKKKPATKAVLKAKKSVPAKKVVAKKPVAKKSPKKSAPPKVKSPKKAKTVAKKSAKSPKSVQKPAAKVTKSPKKTKAINSKVAKPRSVKKAAPKKK